ncbi:hypothetical protein GCM10023322_70640 [Rugosimonospora acidiphila]|uniref:Beta-galactosidase trimerisation domain-containing protein n=1 Tax=Rugosimonospora acidiphila TaxID=556531 RepID=A0ABP9SKG2_9ACTN
MELSRRSFLVGAAGVAAAGLGSSLLGGGQAAAAGPLLSAPATVDPVSLPAKALRGFGSVSAELTALGTDGSLLAIQCADTNAAKLVHAKYLSDLTRLPGISQTTLTVNGLTVPVYETPTGVVAALTDGDAVRVIAATSAAQFTASAGSAIPAGTIAADFAAQTTVPMYLDRFDKYGLLLYFVPLALPPGWTRGQPYDYRQDFDFVEDNELGGVIWDNEQQLNTGEGLARVPDWGFAVEEFLARDVPVHLNTQLADGLWLANRYRDQTMQKMPQYSGFYATPASYTYAVGATSYCSTTGMDAELGVLQDTVRQFAGHPNVVGWLEPHGELSGGSGSVLLAEFGPVADASFRTFLQERYATPAALSQAWYGNSGAVASWDDVHVPEVASFLGWSEDALDVAGSWRVLYPGTGSPPTGWDQPSFDDSGWGTVVMPGSDRVEFLPRQLMAARRSVPVPAAWLSAHPSVWLYLFDLNTQTTIPVTVNGNATGGIPAAAIMGGQHCGALEVTDWVSAGDNLIALTLPQGYIGYRCYLSGEAPVHYPLLGPQKNTRWIDFQDWTRWIRQGAVRRGVEMIRQEDATRPVNLMSPDTYADLLKQVAADFGGNFHNTGYMAGVWADYHPLLSRSAGRPSTAEPGNGAPDAAQLQACFGRWISEGLNGVHYFGSQQDIMSKPDVLAAFQDNIALYRSIGKYHVPPAEVAVLNGFRVNGNGTWPWLPDADVWVPGGYWKQPMTALLLPLCPRDAVTEADFADGTVNRYRVIIDSNTSFMDDALIEQIETWVRDGGTFITYVQTGRHTTTDANAWPISDLTGYDVASIDPYEQNGSYQPRVSHPISAAPGQTLLADTSWLANVRGGGLSLSKVAPECEDVLLWDDGSVAVGTRPLGNGRIIHLGWHVSGTSATALLDQVLHYLDVARVPAKATAGICRHYISNTGLHDVWVLFNESAGTISTDLTFASPGAPTALSQITGTATTPVTTVNGVPGVYGISLAAWETRLYLSPRTDVPHSALDWLNLQRDWWAGTTAPSPTPLPTPAQQQRNSVALSDEWAFQPVDDLTAAQIAALVLPGVDDSAWERRDLGVWGMPDHPDVAHAVLRRTFTIPSGWATGDTELWMAIDKESSVFKDAGRIYVDGALIQNFNAGGLVGLAANTLLPPGEHLIALEVQGSGMATGVTSNAWVYHLPAPDATQDLSGSWALTGTDGIHDAGTVTMPGAFTGLFMARDVSIDASRSGSTAVLYVHRPGASVNGVLINGTFIGDIYPATRLGDTLLVNITTKVRFGQTNRIELVSVIPTAALNVTGIEIRYYNPSVYP